MQIIQNRAHSWLACRRPACGPYRHLDTGLGRAAAGDSHHALRGFLWWRLHRVIASAEGLLRGEGFTDFRYVPGGVGATAAALIAKNRAGFAGSISRVRSSLPSIPEYGSRGFCGVDLGCWELFFHEGINSIRDL